MNGEGGIGRAEEDLGYLRGEFVTGFELGSPFMGGFYPNISVGPFIPQFTAYAQLPAIRDLPTVPQASTSDPEAVGDEAVQAVEVIDPEFGETTTVFEDAPGGIYETNRAPTDWGAFYDEYVVLNPPVVPEVTVPVFVPREVEQPPVVATTYYPGDNPDPMPGDVLEEEPVLHDSIDWGGVVGTIVGGIADPFGIGDAAASYFRPTAVAAPTVQPGRSPVPAVTVDPRTGQLVRCAPRRRRRRRLLTESDFNDLMRISTLPNKDNVKIALAKAIGR